MAFSMSNIGATPAELKVTVASTWALASDFTACMRVCRKSKTLSEYECLVGFKCLAILWWERLKALEMKTRALKKRMVERNDVLIN